MSFYKYMRIIVMYDLPNNNCAENKDYSRFRKLLIKNGYTMIQFSVYMKCLNVKTKFKSEVKKISKFVPPQGNIRVMAITEKQFQDMIFLRGDSTINEKVNGVERYISIKD
ncbi:MAG: CRISPR-associated endonuclease Cas2 [Malacoplasma sp.]|nr:CRISPR-associated endonuclease Cas2 [Malacoplasma sp.]